MPTVENGGLLSAITLTRDWGPVSRLRRSGLFPSLPSAYALGYLLIAPTVLESSAATAGRAYGARNFCGDRPSRRSGLSRRRRDWRRPRDARAKIRTAPDGAPKVRRVCAAWGREARDNGSPGREAWESVGVEIERRRRGTNRRRTGDRIAHHVFPEAR